MKMIWITVVVLALLALVVAGYMQLPKFGRAVRGARLARVEASENYRDGAFRNLEYTPQMTSDKGRVRVMFDFLFESRPDARPKAALPSVKSDLKALDRSQELLVWFGHSSYLLQSGGVRFLVDPVFADAAPVSFFNQAFEGTERYTAQDMPPIDYLIVTHDHWDHLDHQTVTALKDRVGRVVCPLGVGEHLEYWGYAPERIVELDWNEDFRPNRALSIHCLPTRHFSGRTLHANQTLWASFMVVTPMRTIYIGGDSGYGIHYKQIADRFPEIDLALLENGQYNPDWRYIHLLPEDLDRVVDELRPRKVLAGHNAKYALAKHPWDEPLEHAAQIKEAFVPQIGQVVPLNDSLPQMARWW